MNWLASSHLIIAVLVLVAWFAGFVILVLGRRAREFDWMSLAVLGIFIVGFAVDLFFIHRDLPGAQKIWARGWIGPRMGPGAITIGILEDPLGLTVSLTAAALGAFLALNRWLIQKEECPERIHAGILMGVAGVAVAWLALTPWLSILGVAICTLGGFVMLGAKQEPELIAQFGRERTWGFVLSFLGAAVLAGGRSALSLQSGFALSAQTLPHSFDLIGGALLLLGVYFFLQPIPFLSYLSRESKVSTGANAIVGQLFSALAGFALITRFEPVFRGLGLFSVFQWIAAGSAILASIAGLVQDGWKTALPFWISAVLSFAFGCVCFAGPTSGFPILIGAAGCASILSVLGAALESGVLGESSLQWARVLCVLAVGPGVSFFGFISCGSVSRVMALAAQDPAHATVFTVVTLMMSLLLWKSVFSIFSSSSPDSHTQGSGNVTPLVTAALLVVLSLGLIWTGTLSGGAIPLAPDRLFSSWLATLFDTSVRWNGQSGIPLGEGLFWASIVLAGILAVWLFGRGQDRVIRGVERSPRLRKFLQSGYSVDRFGGALVRGLRCSGEFLERWISEKVSVNWVPRALEWSLQRLSQGIDEADQKMYLQEGSVLRQWVEVPSKALQLVQNGDLQWYLVFAIGCVVAILIHFFRFI